MALAPLVFVIDANTAPFTAKMALVTASVKAGAAKMGTAFMAVNGQVGAMATKISLVGGILGGLAVKSASSFEHSMARARTQTDLTAEEWKVFSQEIRNAAATFGQTDLASVGGAVFDAFSTGAKDAAEALDIVSVAMEANVGSGIELDTAVKFVTQQWKTFQPRVRDARVELDRMAATTRVGSGTAQQFAEAFTLVSAQASAFGLTQEELSSVLADLSLAMGGPAKAATGFQQILSALETPTNRQAKAVDVLNQRILEQANVNSASIATWGGVDNVLRSAGLSLIDFSRQGVNASGGIQQFTRNLVIAMGEAQDNDENVRGLIRSVEGWNSLATLGADSAHGWGIKLGEITNATGGVEEQFNIMSDTFDERLKVAIASTKELSLTLIGEGEILEDLGGFFEMVTEKTREWKDAIVELKNENPVLFEQWKDGIVTFTLWTVGLAIGTKVLTGFVAAVTLALKPLKWIGIAILWLVKTPLFLWLLALEAIVFMISVVDVDWEKAIKNMGYALVKFVFKAKTAAEGLRIFVDEMVSSFADSIMDVIGGAIDWVWNKFKSFFTWLAVSISKIPNIFGANSKEFSTGGSVQEFAHGGAVHGPAGLDVIPARLTSGEFVINPVASRLLGKETLEALNRIGQGGTSSSPFVESLTINATGGGVVDEQMIREVLLPELERLSERSLSPRARGIR